MGLNAFRLGIEWSRVQPTYVDQPGPAPAFDESALDRYAEICWSVAGTGWSRVVTLHHFVHPAWLGSDPWLEPGMVEHFCRYVEKTVLYVNRALTDRHGVEPIRYYITVNEPNMLVLNTYFGTQFPGRKHHPTGLRSVAAGCRQMLQAHVKAYNLIHNWLNARVWGPPMVSFNNYCSDLYWSDKSGLDLISVRERGVKPSELRDYVYGKIHEFEKLLLKPACRCTRIFRTFLGTS